MVAFGASPWVGYVLPDQAPSAGAGHRTKALHPDILAYFRTRLVDGRPKDAKDNMEICLTTTDEFATSDDPSAIQDDIYLGVALNLLFAKDDILDENNCQVTRSEGLAAALNPDDAFKTTYVYSNSFIDDVMVPELQGLKTLAGGSQALDGTVNASTAHACGRSCVS